MTEAARCVRCIRVSGRLAVAAALLMALAAPRPSLAQIDTQQLGNPAAQLGQAAKFWNAAMFGPSSFRKTSYPNPDAEPNTVTVSAYQPSLSDGELVELAVAKVKDKWGKRGDIGLYFPAGVPGTDGKMHFVFGKPAESYISGGGLLTGLTTVGMPVDDIGSANWAKNVAMVNFTHGVMEAKQSKVFKRALADIARQKPELAAAAQKFDLSSSGLQQALGEQAGRNPALAKAMVTLMKQATSPTAFVVNAGFTDNTDGGLHYGMAKRQANEARRPTRDQVVTGKVANLLFQWWKKVLPNAKTLDPRLFAANHCAGVYDDADWLFALEAKIKREAPEMLKPVMRRTYSYDLGAGANRPDGVRHLTEIGAGDMFGQMNTPTSVLGKAKMGRWGHMTNQALGELNPDGVPSLKVKPFAAAFGLRLYDSPSASTKNLSARRSTFLATLAKRYGDSARHQESVLKDLRKESPAEDKLWTTYKIAEANLKGNRAIYEAKQQRALALSKLAKLKADGASKQQISAAWAVVKAARVTQKQAERDLSREISRVGLLRNRVTDATQYNLYIHGGQGTARQKHLERQGPAAMAAYKQRSERFGKAFAGQVVGLYGRAQVALQTVRQQLGQPAQPAAAGGNR